jgi:hypothetical protein
MLPGMGFTSAVSAVVQPVSIAAARSAGKSILFVAVPFDSHADMKPSEGTPRGSGRDVGKSPSKMCQRFAAMQ